MREDKSYFVYILCSRPNGPIYIGVTNDLKYRVTQHRNGEGSKHTAKYKIQRLVYYEEFGDIDLAISREKVLKRWRRAWKDRLITEFNVNWDDLYYDLPEA